MSDPARSKVIASTAIPLTVALGWGMGSLGMSTLFQAMSVLLLRYMTDFMGIAAGTGGLLIGVSKLFDAFVDPLIGVASDKTRSRWGRRRPYLLAGGIFCAVSFWLMFNVPAGGGLGQRLLAMEAVLLLFAFGYGLFNIPYMAMPTEMSDAPQQRTLLISYRVTAIAVGSILASFVGPILIQRGGGGVSGHKLMAGVVAGVVLATSLICFFATRRARFTTTAVKTGYGFKQQIKLAVENKPFVALICVKLSQLLGAGVTFAVTPFVFIQILKAPYTLMGLYFLIQYLAMIASQPFWVAACKHLGKKRAYYLAAPFTILVSLSWLLVHKGDPMIVTMGRGVALGFLGGASLLIMQAMLPDTIQYDFIRTGLRREGVFAGVYTTVEKVAGAFASAMVGIIIGAFGYVASTGKLAIQPHSAIIAIYGVAALPALTMALSCVAFLFYTLDDSTLLAASAAAELRESEAEGAEVAAIPAALA